MKQPGGIPPTRRVSVTSGGDLVAEVLVRARGEVPLHALRRAHLADPRRRRRRRGVRVVDTRHEATAVFAADAVARLTGVPGVAAVTAGPGRDEHGHGAPERPPRAVAARPPRRGDGDGPARARGAPGHRPARLRRGPIVKWATAVTKVRGPRPRARAGVRRSAAKGSPARSSSSARSTSSTTRRSCGAGTAGSRASRRGSSRRRRSGTSAGTSTRSSRAAGDAPRAIPSRRPRPRSRRPGASGRRRSSSRAASAPSSSSGAARSCRPPTRRSLARAVAALGSPGLPLGHGSRPPRARLARSSSATAGRRRCARPTSSSSPGVPCDFRLDYGQADRALGRRSSP